MNMQTQPATQTDNTDPLTIAYVSMGAYTHKRFDQAVRIHDDGELGLIQSIIDLTPAVEAAYTKVGEDYDGVFAYSIVKPIGEWIIDQLLQFARLPNADAVEMYATRLMARE